MDKSDDGDSKASPEERRVAPIRVVNLASLQDIKIVNKEMQNRINRRKSVHQVRSNSDDELEFIESHAELNNDTSSSNSTVASASTSTSTSAIPVTVIRKSKISHNQTTATSLSGRQPGSNANLMKRVALLRVCAEYMLKELQIKNVEFGENQSLEMLKAQYIRNSRRQN